MLQNIKQKLGLTGTTKQTTSAPVQSSTTTQTDMEPSCPDPNKETAANAVYNHFHNLDLLDLIDEHADDSAYTATTIAHPDSDDIERGLTAAFESTERITTNTSLDTVQKRFGRDTTLGHDHSKTVTLTHKPSASTVELTITPVQRFSVDPLYFLITPDTDDNTTFIVRSRSKLGLYNAKHSTVTYASLLNVLAEINPREHFTTHALHSKTSSFDLPDIHGTAFRTAETNSNIELTTDVPHAPTTTEIINIISQFGTIAWESGMTRTTTDTDTNRRTPDWDTQSILLADASLTITFNPFDKPIDSHLTLTPIIDPYDHADDTHTYIWASWSLNTTDNPVEYNYIIELPEP